MASIQAIVSESDPAWHSSERLHLKARYKDIFWRVGGILITDFDSFDRLVRLVVRPLLKTDPNSHPLRFEYRDPEGDTVLIDSTPALDTAVNLITLWNRRADHDYGLVQPCLLCISVFDAPVVDLLTIESKVIHPNKKCENCGTFPIIGPLYKCVVRKDFEICARCEVEESQLYRTSNEVPPFIYLKINHPGQTSIISEFFRRYDTGSIESFKQKRHRTVLTDESIQCEFYSEMNEDDASDLSNENLDVAESDASDDDSDSDSSVSSSPKSGTSSFTSASFYKKEVEKKVGSTSDKILSYSLIAVEPQTHIDICESTHISLQNGICRSDSDTSMMQCAERVFSDIITCESHVDNALNSDICDDESLVDTLRSFETKPSESVVSICSSLSNINIPEILTTGMVQDTLNSHLNIGANAEVNTISMTKPENTDSNQKLYRKTDSDKLLSASVGKLAATMSASRNTTAQETNQIAKNAVCVLGIQLMNATDGVITSSAKLGQNFSVQLEFRNNFLSPISEDTCLMKFSGELMSGPTKGIFVGSKKAGECFSVEIPFVAPSEPGTYKTFWSFHAYGKFFGDVISIDAIVDPAADESPGKLSRKFSDDWSIVEAEQSATSKLQIEQQSESVQVDFTEENSKSEDIPDYILGKAAVALLGLQISKEDMWLWNPERREFFRKSKLQFAEELKVLTTVGFGCGYNALNELCSNYRQKESTMNMNQIVSNLMALGHLRLSNEIGQYHDVLRVLCEIGIFPDRGFDDCIGPVHDLLSLSFDECCRKPALECICYALRALQRVAREDRDENMEEVFVEAQKDLMTRWDIELGALKDMGFEEENGNLRSLLEEYVKVPGASGLDEIIPILLASIDT